MSSEQISQLGENTGDGRAADLLFRRFVQMINAGELQDGQTLPPEREIVQQYGVSRTVVREAVLALANKGLVEARPRFRPVVRKPSYDTAMDMVGNLVGRLLHEPGGIYNLFETRIMIEAGLARQAALEAKPDDLDRMHAALADNTATAEDSAAFYQSDMAFHRIFYDIPGNPVLPALHKAYVTWLGPQWSRMPRLSVRNRENCAAHQRIFDAIVAKDPDRAEQSLRQHLKAAWQQVRATFDMGEPE